MKTKREITNTKITLVKGASAEPILASFTEVVSLIEQARKRAYKAANTQLIDLYWKVGGYISRKIEADGWGKGTVRRFQVLKRSRLRLTVHGVARPKGLVFTHISSRQGRPDNSPAIYYWERRCAIV